MKKTKITDVGLEIESSITDTTLAVIAFAGGLQGAAIAVALKAMLMLKEILRFFGYFGSDTKVRDASRSLQEQINRVHIDRVFMYLEIYFILNQRRSILCLK